MRVNVGLESRIIVLVGTLLIGCCAFYAAGMGADSMPKPKSREGNDSAATDANAANVSASDGIDRTPKLCGRYGLFMLLRLLGHDIPYAEIERLVPVGLRGSSLLELRNAAEKLGIKLTIYKSEPTAREATRLPVCLALIGAEYRNGQNGERVMLQGHFVLVEQSSNTDGHGELSLIDGLYGFRETMSGNDFASIWTGCYLTSSPSSFGALWPPVAIVLFAALLGCTIWHIRRRKSTRTSGCALVQNICLLRKRF